MPEDACNILFRKDKVGLQTLTVSSTETFDQI